MPQLLKIGVSQSRTLSSLQETLSALRETTQSAAQKGVSILLFPEAYLGGYPRTCSFGAAIGARTAAGRDQFLAYTKSAVDLGDTPSGAGDDWTDRKLPVNKETGRRGDGTREFLEEVARETGVFVVTGLIEKAGGSLYCAAVYVDPKRGIIGKRRKIMPTGSERLVWAQGQPSTLKAVATTVKGIRVVMGCAICWENFMPLLRYSLYSQGVNLWLAPTADARDTWEPLMKTVAGEGRCFVLSTNQCMKKKDLPSWVTGNPSEWLAKQPKPESETLMNGTASSHHHSVSSGGRRLSMTRTEENHEIAWRCKDSPIDESKPLESSQQEVNNNNTTTPSTLPDGEEYVTRGGACIVNPLGQTIAGPVWEKDNELLWTEVDFDDCERGHLDFDATGHYARPDAFKLTVEGLELIPPP
ncbi:hypothetical protein AYO21_09209 [Fonsecaea monophora]|uniref:CN hydrolase domain-containing protein n=1 Tax=Fonsecaea monophora TaxID=254056 RepID=A0A177EZR6_9EURO|nr:hypothetical protein AYO21_09209 [Fonsecaea monophora]OAG36552.1 hypothetical protein AYO21_09209 [Fonsecaea monophora]